MSKKNYIRYTLSLYWFLSISRSLNLIRSPPVFTATTFPGCRYSAALALGCSMKYSILLRVTSALGVSSSLDFLHLTFSFLVILYTITSFSLLAFLNLITSSSAFFILQTALDCFQVE